MKPYSFILMFVIALVSVGTTQAASSNDTYYKIGGGSPVSISAGRGHQPGQFGLGVRWRDGSACSGLNPTTTVENQLNGVSRGFHTMMSRVVQNARAAVAALPAMIIQNSDPGLYDLLSNGVLQGKINFNRAKTSCQAMAKKAADAITSNGWKHQAMAENWPMQAHNNPDAVQARRQVETQGGDDGVTWVGGQKAGGVGEQPIQVTQDAVIAGYNLLQGRADTRTTAPVPGGGRGWGAQPTVSGDWAGARTQGGQPPSSGCQGGMCTVWGSPQKAASWIKNVVGGKTIRTCSGCDKVESQSGTGLMQVLQKQQAKIGQKLAGMVNGSVSVNQANLRAVSAGPGLAVSRDVIKALHNDPKSGLLTHRLAGEMALSRTLTQAIWARRVLLAGANAPGITDNQQAQKALNHKLTHLDRGIKGLRTEMQVRQSLAHNAANVALTRQRARGNRHPDSRTAASPERIDSHEPIKASSNDTP